MTRKVVSNSRSIVVFRRIFLLLFFRDSWAENRRRRIPAVSCIKPKFTERAQQNAPLLLGCRRLKFYVSDQTAGHGLEWTKYPEVRNIHQNNIWDSLEVSLSWNSVKICDFRAISLSGTVPSCAAHLAAELVLRDNSETTALGIPHSRFETRCSCKGKTEF